MPAKAKRPEHGVAMWGAPSSGKTTFLAALDIALTRDKYRRWNLTGADEASTEMLVNLTTAIADRRFPPATVGMDEYTWVLEKLPAQAARRWRWFRQRRPDALTGIGLGLVDASGEIFASQNPHSVDTRRDLVGKLESSGGIVFLFDPIREVTRGDVFTHTFGMLAELASSMVDSPARIDGRLPHYVAVCITKFDEPRVLETAAKMDLLTADPADRYQFPRVADEDAEELCGHLCEVSRSGNAELVMNKLKRQFLPDRIRFFVTSSIGFYVDPAIGDYDPDDYQNQLPDEDRPGWMRIRGAVYPINVVEPMLWLAAKLSGK